MSKKLHVVVFSNTNYYASLIITRRLMARFRQREVVTSQFECPTSDLSAFQTIASRRKKALKRYLVFNVLKRTRKYLFYIVL